MPIVSDVMLTPKKSVKKVISKEQEEFAAMDAAMSDMVRRIGRCDYVETFISLHARSVRIGSYKTVSSTSRKTIPVAISSSGILYDVPHVADKWNNIKCFLDASHITTLYYHASRKVFVIFVHTTPRCASYIRHKVGMGDVDTDEPDSFYFDPTNDDTRKRFVIFVLEGFSEENSILLQRFMTNTVVSMSYEEANDWLVQFSGAGLGDSPILQVPGPLEMSQSQSSSSATCSSPTPSSSSSSSSTVTSNTLVLDKTRRTEPVSTVQAVLNRLKSKSPSSQSKSAGLRSLMSKHGKLIESRELSGASSSASIALNSGRKSLKRSLVTASSSTNESASNGASETEETEPRKKYVRSTKPKKKINTEYDDLILNSYSNFHVSVHDMKTLDDEGFLNDNILSFAIKDVMDECMQESDRLRTQFFSTYFYKRLTERPLRRMNVEIPPPGVKLSAAARRYQRVRKWTKNVNIFKKDFIVIPINTEFHWVIAIVCYPYLSQPVDFHTGKPVDLHDEPESKAKRKPVSSTSSNSNHMEGVDKREHDYARDSNTPKVKRPCIVIFDSMEDPYRRRRIARCLLEYIDLEYQEKVKVPTRTFKASNFPCIVPYLPQQQNFYDCGVYMWRYLRNFFEHPILDYRRPIDLMAWPDMEYKPMVQYRKTLFELIKEDIVKTNPKMLKYIPEITFADPNKPPPSEREMVEFAKRQTDKEANVNVEEEELLDLDEHQDDGGEDDNERLSESNDTD